jgi:replicative DNA helicase
MSEETKKLFNIEAEQSILGTVIFNSDYFDKISDILIPEYFYEPAHQKIYEYITTSIFKHSVSVDSVTLNLFFNNDETIKKIGGEIYLATLLKIGSNIVDVRDYAEIIKDLAIKRKIVLIAENIVLETYKDSSMINSDNLIEKIESDIFNLSIKNNDRISSLTLKSSLEATREKIKLAMDTGGNISGVTSGFIDLDQYTGGFQNGDLIIVAGRPSMGKSALAINFAYNIAKDFLNKDKGKDKIRSVAFFSLEMPSEQISARILSMETGINTTKFRKGEVSPGEYDKIADKINEINKIPLFIDDTPSLSIGSIKTKTRRLIKQKNLGAIVVDYLQLATGITKRSSENRVLEIGEITMGLKAIAKEFNIPVIALSQLSRLLESRVSKKPQLSDLRESGSIEQDADIVMFIYREEYYIGREKPNDSDKKIGEWQKKMEEVRNKAELIIAKHRNGDTGTVELFFNKELGRFVDWAGKYEIKQ